MSNTIKISGMFLIFSFLFFLPKVSYAFDDQHGHDGGGPHHWHGPHLHANPDLTLVTGMDTIDSRVLVAADPDQAPEMIDQPQQVVETTMPTPMAGPDTDDSITINVPKSSGGYTSIRIQKWGNGYLGPQGEFYYPFPQVSELKAMYGI